MMLRQIDPQALSRWAAILPLVTFNLCYVIAAGLEHLPQCIPYLSGCTSASSSGRLAPESWFFRAGLLPVSAVMFFLWRGFAAQIDATGSAPVRAHTLRVLAITTAACLLIYTLTIDVPGPDFRAVRKFGIRGFAICNFLAQLTLLSAFRPLRADRERHLWLLGICLAAPVFGMVAELAKLAGTPRYATNNIMAWNSLLLQCAWFWLLARFLKHDASRR